MRTRDNETERPHIWLGATVVAQPLIGNFNNLRLFGGFMAARFSSQSRKAGFQQTVIVCVCRDRSAKAHAMVDVPG